MYGKGWRFTPKIHQLIRETSGVRDDGTAYRGDKQKEEKDFQHERSRILERGNL